MGLLEVEMEELGRRKTQESKQLLYNKLRVKRGRFQDTVELEEEVLIYAKSQEGQR